ncbi:hypothetical protein U9M48_033022 [Paspalum notatum var. saurae]|uniref:Uncharacterized protein n=1 Tax=Paspalum notatum var. saurae TaxID=547442 RepID=A0AAQ3U722_PASNO
MGEEGGVRREAGGEEERVGSEEGGCRELGSGGEGGAEEGDGHGGVIGFSSEILVVIVLIEGRVLFWESIRSRVAVNPSTTHSIIFASSHKQDMSRTSKINRSKNLLQTTPSVQSTCPRRFRPRPAAKDLLLQPRSAQEKEHCSKIILRINDRRNALLLGQKGNRVYLLLDWCEPSRISILVFSFRDVTNGGDDVRALDLAEAERRLAADRRHPYGPELALRRQQGLGVSHLRAPLAQNAERRRRYARSANATACPAPAAASVNQSPEQSAYEAWPAARFLAKVAKAVGEGDKAGAWRGRRRKGSGVWGHLEMKRLAGVRKNNRSYKHRRNAVQGTVGHIWTWEPGIYLKAEARSHTTSDRCRFCGPSAVISEYETADERRDPTRGNAEEAHTSREEVGHLSFRW